MTFAPYPDLASLRARISRIEQQGCGVREARVLPFGVEAIDHHLVSHGLPLGALHEFSADAHPSHEAAMIAFVCGILARLSGPVIWCLRRNDLFAPGLAAFGLDTARVHYAEVPDEKTLLILMEEGLRHAGLAGVVGEVSRLSITSSRRLHLAARTSGVTAFAMQRLTSFAKQKKQEPTAAESRWRISSLPSCQQPVAEVGRPRWKVELVRSRDSEPRVWELEGCDATGSLALPAEFGKRPIAQDWQLSA